MKKKSKRNGRGRHGRPTDAKQARPKGRQQSAGRQDAQADGAAATPTSYPRVGGRCVWQEWMKRTGSRTAQLMVKIEQDATKPDEHDRALGTIYLGIGASVAANIIIIRKQQK